MLGIDVVVVAAAIEMTKAHNVKFIDFCISVVLSFYIGISILNIVHLTQIKDYYFSEKEKKSMRNTFFFIRSK